MRFFDLPSDLILFSDAGGGAPAEPAADPGAVAGGAGTPPAAPPAAAPSAGVPPAPAEGEFYRPQGLPQHLLGKDQNETMDNLAKALDGYRSRDAQASIPDNAEAYGAFPDTVPETIRPHLDTLKGDPLFGRVAARALELKVPVPAYQALTQEFLSVAHEMGIMEPIVDVEAERQALVPEAARHLPSAEQAQAVEKRMNDNYAFLDAAVAQGAEKGGLSREDAEFAKAMLGDSAKGHRLFEWIRARSADTSGGPALAAAGAAGGLDPADDLRRRQALPENTVGDKAFNRQSYDQLIADYKRIYGN